VSGFGFDLIMTESLKSFTSQPQAYSFVPPVRQGLLHRLPVSRRRTRLFHPFGRGLNRLPVSRRRTRLPHPFGRGLNRLTVSRRRTWESPRSPVFLRVNSTGSQAAPTSNLASADFVDFNAWSSPHRDRVRGRPAPLALKPKPNCLYPLHGCPASYATATARLK
jgi:hypothetical protein